VIELTTFFNVIQTIEQVIDPIHTPSSPASVDRKFIVDLASRWQ